MKLFIKKYKIKSISTQVSLSLFIVTFLIFIITELIILERSYSSLLKSLDINLRTHAEALVSLTEIDDDGEIEFDYKDAIKPVYSGRDLKIYFVIVRKEDNIEIIRSHSLDGYVLQLPVIVKEYKFKNIYFWNSYINNNKVRFIAFNKEIKPDPDEIAESHIKLYSHECTFIAGKDMKDINKQFIDIFKLTSVSLGVGLILLLILEKFLLKKYLKPLNEFKNEVKQISAINLSPVSIPDVSEIAVIAETLNQVIGHLKDAFSRERRFTSNVAHELRTPISEIRTLVEVVLNYPDGLSKDDLENYRDILESAKQMQNIVNNLLILTRLDSNALTSQRELFDLDKLITASWDRYENKAALKNLSLIKNAPVPFMIYTDKEMIKTIMDNLISNAIDYSVDRSSVQISGALNSNRFRISVVNCVTNLTRADIPLMFERFWRKDEARTSDNNHCGLGLSLVNSLVQFLSFHIQADLDDDSYLNITISGQIKSP